ncbi:MAG: bifunctional (p)ppGpp synthetase/guanosine-3',5'-bis(diphosphate) 3'-pyrophosphohydrolase, partial [Treponema sp.]|nr:bifunctional (p)ppGpp synthetase/guanosine-3',5'-bis(diphosphate) 3'-pyrophosphohydrolase [Treponema sp.]
NTTNFIVTFAKCCNPKYPDPISGYVSTGRGLIIHKANCITFHRIPNIQKRTLEVEWEVEKDK